jgi:hypothetical protein
MKFVLDFNLHGNCIVEAQTQEDAKKLVESRQGFGDDMETEVTDFSITNIEVLTIDEKAKEIKDEKK